jgi:hypothetical protein
MYKSVQKNQNYGLMLKSDHFGEILAFCKIFQCDMHITTDYILDIEMQQFISHSLALDVQRL